MTPLFFLFNLSPLTCFLVVAFWVIAFIVLGIRDAGRAAQAKADERRLLEEMGRELRQRQQQTLAEITRYPEDSPTDVPAWLFLGYADRYSHWLLTDAEGRYIDDATGKPDEKDLEQVELVVAYGKETLQQVGIETARCKDISQPGVTLTQMVGRLFLENGNVRLRGMDNAEAQALMTYRCFMQLRSNERPDQR